MAGRQNITHGAGGKSDALSSIPSALYGGRSGQISCVSVSSTAARGARAGPYTRASVVLPGQCHSDHCTGPADAHDAHRPTGLWGGGPLPPRWAERTKVVALPQGAKELTLTDQPPKGPLMAVT